MTLPVLTYEDYVQLGGLLSEERFGSSLCAACASVREIIGFNEPEDETDTEAYKRAVVAAVEVDAAYGHSSGIGEGADSISIGSFSISSGSESGTDVSAYDADMRRVIRRELIGSTLLFQGLD